MSPACYYINISQIRIPLTVSPNFFDSEHTPGFPIMTVGYNKLAKYLLRTVPFILIEGRHQ